MSSNSSQKENTLEIPLFLQLLLFKKRELLIGASSVLAAVAILIVYFQSGPKAGTYASAEAAYETWKASPNSEELYETMKESFRTVPSLQRKYEAEIAQKLLDTERTQEALEWVKGPLERIKSETPFHSSYAETSLLIEQGSFQEALEKSVQLKEQMNQSFDIGRLSEDPLVGGSLLYAHNLLRIASIQQRLNNRPGKRRPGKSLKASCAKEHLFSSLLSETFLKNKLI